MTNDSTAVDFGINLLEEEIDDVIFRTNEFLTDATFTGGQGPFWWILQMSMALAGLFAIIMCANMAYKMMVKREPLDVMKLFKPLAISIILCWWYPPAEEVHGVPWTSLATYPMLLVVTPMTSMKRKQRK